MYSKVAIVGAGNVAWHLFQAFADVGLEVNQWLSRSTPSEHFSSVSLSPQSIESLDSDADLVFLAVADDAVAQVSARIPKNFKGLVVHTSGAVSMDKLADHLRYGVFYPLQTFSKGNSVDYSQVPVFIEANHKPDAQNLAELGKKVFSKERVTFLNSEKRKNLHVAAVFVCNFVNHMYTLGAEIMEAGDMDFDLLRPLIEETAQKIQHQHPFNAQTGPARRGDQKVINAHLDFLNSWNEEEDIYRLVTESIIRRNGK